jgi:hypothetical protein
MIKKQAPPEEIQSLRVVLKKLKAAQDFYFVYFDKGEGGSPSLLVDKKKIPMATVKELLSKAVLKKPVRGLVRLSTEDKAVEFLPLKSPGKLQRSLKSYYRRVPELKRARVILGDDPSMVEARMEQADDELEVVKRQEVLLGSEIEQLEASLKLLEDQEAEARFAVEDAQTALDSRWFFQRKHAFDEALGAAQARAGRSRHDLDAARAELEERRKALVSVEQERMHAEEDAEDLADIWSAIQSQQWDQRRAKDAEWRGAFQSQMHELAASSESVQELKEDAERQREQVSALKISLQALRLQLEQPSPPDDLRDRIAHAEVSLEWMSLSSQQADEALQQAQDEYMLIEQKRNAIFMTESERERSTDLRVELLNAQATAVESETRCMQACQVEEAAYAGLEDIHELHKELEAMRKQRSRLQLEVNDLQGTASQWSWFKSSRRKASHAAAEELPEKQAALEAMEASLQQKQEKLESLERVAGGSLGQAKESTALRLKAERADVASNLRVLHHDQKIAEESADIAEWHVELRQAALNKAIQADSVLSRSAEQRDERLNTADQSASAVVDQEIVLAGLRQEQEALALRLRSAYFADADTTLQLVALTDQIAEKTEALELSRKRADLQTKRAEKASADFETLLADRALELKISGKPGLLETLHAAESADRELESAIRHNEAAIDNQERLLDQLSELDRSAGAYELILDGESLVAESAEVFAALRGMDLFESEDVEKVREVVGPAMDRIQAQLNTLAADLIQAGATQDELARVFERVPNGLRPAAYRKEVSAVNELLVRFDELAEKQAADDRDAYLIRTATESSPEEMLRQIKMTLSEMDQLRGDASWVAGQVLGKTGLASSWLTALGAVDGSEPSMEALKSVQTFLFQFGSGLGAAGALSGAVGAFSTENPDDDPVLQKLQDKQKLDALNGLVSSGLDIARHIVPIVGLPRLGKGFLESVVHAAARTYRAQADAKLKALARMEGSELAGALEESLQNEWRLAADYGFSATASAGWIASSLLSAEPTQALSFAVAVTTKTVSFAHNVVTSARDWKLAKKANTLLERARAGDARAKSELLKNHGRYAKGLLALKAQQGDAFALEYASSRGLSESDINASSFEIITRYLLSESKQSNVDHLETFDDWVESRKALLSRLVGILMRPLEYLWGTVSGWLDSPASIDGLELPPIEMPVTQASELIAMIRDGVDLRGRLAQRDAPTPAEEAQLKTTLARIDELMAEQTGLLNTCRDMTITQLEQISEIEARFQARLIDPLEMSEEDKGNMVELRTRVMKTRREHVELLTTLSEAI